MEVSGERILIHICTKDRPSEVAMLLQSLRTQTYQDFDVLILEDGSTTPLQSYYFLPAIITLMKMEGHYVKVIRNEQPSGVSRARQQLVDYAMTNLPHKLYLRLDDDIICENNYIEELKKGLDSGYDLMSGLTVPFGPIFKRDIKIVEPIIGYCEFDDKGELIANFDDCGTTYHQKKILPTTHFRSCALYKKELHNKGVDYNSRLSRNGFREEQIFSFKAIIKGFKLGVNTSAVNYHLLTPSGGERDTMNMTNFNQKVFEETTKRMFEDNGDFLKDYYKRIGVKPKVFTKEELIKASNLVYHR
jgi:glycosyltransferase involved in cell wall biosynthesis